MIYNMKNSNKIGQKSEIEKILDNPIPPYVNWELTNKCNMGCPYCFLGENPEGVLSDLSTKKSKALIEKLVRGGAKMLNYAGGEPLLREDIIELIKYGKELGLETILSTNGILLSEDLIKELESCLDWISLPIDGYNSETHDSVRGRNGHFEEIIKHLYKLEETGINLKINTMVCRKNVAYVEEIAVLLDNFNIKKWKLFQFSARGKAKKIRAEYEISNDEFLASKENIGNHRYDIIYSSNELRDNAYFLIGADGKVHVPAKDEYLYLGNLLYDELNKFKNPEILKIEKNITNAEISYNLEV